MIDAGDAIFIWSVMPRTICTRYTAFRTTLRRFCILLLDESHAWRQSITTFAVRCMQGKTAGILVRDPAYRFFGGLSSPITGAEPYNVRAFFLITPPIYNARPGSLRSKDVARLRIASNTWHSDKTHGAFGITAFQTSTCRLASKPNDRTDAARSSRSPKSLGRGPKC